MINRFSSVIVKIFFGLFIVLYSVANIFFSVYTKNYESYHAYYNSGYTVLSILFLVFIIIGLYILIGNDFFKIKDRHLLLIFLITCLIVGLVWIFICPVNFVEYDDAYNTYSSALAYFNGDINAIKQGSYLSLYPNNFGIFTLDLINIKIFGEVGALYSIRIINIICALIGYYSLYKLCDLLFSNRLVNCVLIYLLIGSMQFIFLAYYIYSYCIAYGLSLYSIYSLTSYIKNDNKKNLLLSIVSLIPAIFVKSNILIVLIAELIYLFLHMINIKRFKLIIVMMVMLFSAYACTTLLHNYYENISNTNYSRTSMPKSTWIAYGMNWNMDTPGYYTPEYENFHISHEYNKDWTDITAKTFIKTTINMFISDPYSAYNFYKHKLLTSWANPEYEVFGQFAGDCLDGLSYSVVNGEGNYILKNFWDASQNVIAVGLMVYLIKRFKKANLIELIGSVVVIGGFLFHIVWETKSLYLYQYLLYLLPYAAYGITSIIKKETNE